MTMPSFERCDSIQSTDLSIFVLAFFFMAVDFNCISESLNPDADFFLLSCRSNVLLNPA